MKIINFNGNNKSLPIEIGLYEDLGDIAKMKTEAKQILNSPMVENLSREDKEVLQSLVNDNKATINFSPARTLKTQVLTKEQQAFNNKVDELWNTHNAELEELFNEAKDSKTKEFMENILF